MRGNGNDPRVIKTIYTPLPSDKPGYPNHYIVFDEVIWKMLYQYPSSLCRDMTAPRDHMISSLKAYFQLPPSQRREQAAWLINEIEDEMKSLGADDENLAIVVFHLYFA